VLETTTTRTFTRKDRVGGRDLVTTILLQPPVGHGERGASSSADIRILLDGPPSSMLRCRAVGWHRSDCHRTCPALRDRQRHEGIVRYEGFESRRVVDENWLAEHARTVRELIASVRLRQCVFLPPTRAMRGDATWPPVHS